MVGSAIPRHCRKVSPRERDSRHRSFTKSVLVSSEAQRLVPLIAGATVGRKPSANSEFRAVIDGETHHQTSPPTWLGSDRPLELVGEVVASFFGVFLDGLAGKLERDRCG